MVCTLIHSLVVFTASFLTPLITDLARFSKEIFIYSYSFMKCKNAEVILLRLRIMTQNYGPVLGGAGRIMGVRVASLMACMIFFPYLSKFVLKTKTKKKKLA